METEKQQSIEEDLRRGPWTVEEDLILTDYISKHGEGRWNSLAKCAGLKRTGKSCRLRWLNYLRPDVRRGNITAEEQLLILDLHSRWGNRWSKIAQHLPGRTDNEIKNYWRTRVQKHAKQLQCDVNSNKFREEMHFIWMPRLLERMKTAAAESSPVFSAVQIASASVSTTDVVVPNQNTTSMSNYEGSAAAMIISGNNLVEERQTGGDQWPEIPAGGEGNNVLRFWELSEMDTNLWNEHNFWFNN